MEQMVKELIKEGFTKEEIEEILIAFRREELSVKNKL